MAEAEQSRIEILTSRPRADPAQIICNAFAASSKYHAIGKADSMPNLEFSDYWIARLRGR